MILLKRPEPSIDRQRTISLILLKEFFLIFYPFNQIYDLKYSPKSHQKQSNFKCIFALCVCIPNIIWVWTNYNGIMHFIYLFMQNICFLIYVVTEQAFLRINTGMLLNNNVFSHELNWSWEFGFLLFYIFFSYYFYWFIFLFY